MTSRYVKYKTVTLSIVDSTPSTKQSEHNRLRGVGSDILSFSQSERRMKQ